MTPHPSLRARLEFLEAELVAEGMFSERFSPSPSTTRGGENNSRRPGSPPLAAAPSSGSDATATKPDARMTEALRYV